MKETLEVLDMARFRSQDCSQASEATQPPSQALILELQTLQPRLLEASCILNRILGIFALAVVAQLLRGIYDCYVLGP